MWRIGIIMKRSLFLISTFLFVTTYSQEITSLQKQSIQKYEKELNRLIEKEKTPNKNLYYIYLIAARDFKLEHLDAFYLKYLNKAIKLETNEDKSEAYWRLIDHHRRSGNIDEAKNTLKEWGSLKQEMKPLMKQAFNLLKRGLNGQKLSEKQRDQLSKGAFSYQYKMQELDDLIKEKSYSKALSLINPRNVQDEMVSTIIRYDLLKTLVLKNSKDSLLCTDTYEKYPKSYSYSMKMCKALIEYSKNGSISKGSLKEVEQVFKNKIYKNDDFLYQALLDLK